MVNEILSHLDTILVGGIVLLIILGLRLCRYPTIQVSQKVKRGEAFASLFYTDEKGAKLLKAPECHLQGKPDYIFKKHITGQLIPFEIKSGQCKEDLPHEGDLMQLVAYFLIIEEVYQCKVPYGRLVYKNKTFTVRHTKRLRHQLKNTIREMQTMYEKEGVCKREAQPSYIKCKNCVCKETVCEWSMDKEGAK